MEDRQNLPLEHDSPLQYSLIDGLSVQVLQRWNWGQGLGCADNHCCLRLQYRLQLLTRLYSVSATSAMVCQHSAGDWEGDAH